MTLFRVKGQSWSILYQLNGFECFWAEANHTQDFSQWVAGADFERHFQQRLDAASTTADVAKPDLG